MPNALWQSGVENQAASVPMWAADWCQLCSSFSKDKNAIPEPRITGASPWLRNILYFILRFLSFVGSRTLYRSLLPPVVHNSRVAAALCCAPCITQPSASYVSPREEWDIEDTREINIHAVMVRSWWRKKNMPMLEWHRIRFRKKHCPLRRYWSKSHRS